MITSIEAPPISETMPTSEPTLKLVSTRCCICNIDDGQPVGSGEDFEYRCSPDTFVANRCRRCQLVYLNPRPANDTLAQIYPANYHAFNFNPDEFGFVYKVRRRLEAKRMLKWAEHLPKYARILDVGCGDGFHLRILRDFGDPSWILEGVDTDSRAVEAAKKSNLQVKHGNLESQDFPEHSYDLILLIMTIEHVENPRQILEQIHRLLKPTGRVVIVTDNVGSPDFSIFGGRHWGGYHFPRHWNLFNKSSLQKLAEATGYDIKELSTPVSPVNWVTSFHNLLADAKSPRWMQKFFTLKSPIVLGVFTLLDMVLSRLGRGGNLRAILQPQAIETKTVKETQS